MKQGKKKSGRDETSAVGPGSDVVGPENRNNPEGIDGIRLLQMLAGGLAVVLLVWLLLHNILHII